MRIKKVSQTTSTQAQVVDGYSTSTTDSYSANYVNNLTGKLLWTNSSPTADFADQDITLSSDDYDVLEFYYRSDIGGNRGQSIRVLKGYGVEFDMYSTSVATRTWRRRAVFTNNTKYHFENCIQLEQGQTTTTHNEYCVPLYVIGYKTGLFD